MRMQRTSCLLFENLEEARAGSFIPYSNSVIHKVSEQKKKKGFTVFGGRHSFSNLLNYARASNIRVAVNATVERILVASLTANSGSRQSAIGVVFRDANGRYHHAMVGRHGEVIISAGAIGSPQLLLLSGIGPRPHLSSWGIPVVCHLPYVAAEPLWSSLVQPQGTKSKTKLDSTIHTERKTTLALSLSLSLSLGQRCTWSVTSGSTSMIIPGMGSRLSLQPLWSIPSYRWWASLNKAPTLKQHPTSSPSPHFR